MHFCDGTASDFVPRRIKIWTQLQLHDFSHPWRLTIGKVWLTPVQLQLDYTYTKQTDNGDKYIYSLYFVRLSSLTFARHLNWVLSSRIVCGETETTQNCIETDDATIPTSSKSQANEQLSPHDQ